MRRVILALAAFTVATSVACERDPASTRAVPRPEKSATHAAPGEERTPRKRGPTPPKGVGYVNAGLNAADRANIRRAVRDLKELGFWTELTEHVVRVTISSRPGEGRILEDGRLADAVMTIQVGGRFPGAWCDVLIYSTALVRDIAQQEAYWAEGRLSAPPPDLRDFWAVILAHELAHCSPRGQKGEGYSTRWEGRVLDALGAARLGSPSN